MADSTAKKTLLFHYATQGAEQAARAHLQLKREMEDSRIAEQRLQAAGDEHKLSLIGQKEAVIAAARAKQDASAAAKQYAADIKKAKEGTDQAAESVSKWRDVAVKAFTAGGVLAGVGMITGAVKGLVSSIGELVERGVKYDALLKANKISIDAARDATSGLVSDTQLLTAANKISAFGLDIGAEKFAQMSKAAVIAAQSMGGDMTKAVDDLITGLSRGSVMILDNLGITLKLGEVNKEAALALGKTVDQLTDQEKKSALTSAAIDQLVKNTAGLELAQDGLGSAMARGKVAQENLNDEIGRTVASWQIWDKAVNALYATVYHTADALGLLESKFQRLARTMQIGAVVTNSFAQQHADALDKSEAALRQIMNGSDELEAKRRKRELQAMDDAQKAYDARGKKRTKQVKDEYDEQVKEMERFQKRQAQLDKLDVYVRDRSYSREQKQLKDDQKLKEAALQADIERSKKAARVKEEEIKQTERLAATVMQTTINGIIAARSGAEAFRNFLADRARALSAYAVGEAAAEFAKGWGKLGTTWGVPNPGAAAHFASAAGWLGLAGGAAIAGAALQTSGGGGGGGSYAPSASSGPSGSFGGGGGGGGSSDGGTKDGGVSHVTNVYVKGRTGVITRKDLKAFGAKIASGRAA